MNALRLIKKVGRVLISGNLGWRIQQEYHSYQTDELLTSLKWQHFFKSPFASVKVNIPAAITPLKSIPKISPVDVVIPWYGDRNIFSLLNRLLSEPHHLIETIYLIDDCTPDQEVVAELVELLNQPQYRSVKYLRAKVNQGFVATANIGLQHSRRDVVLLNSDVLPMGNWLWHMLQVAESNEAIATVTPLSNNATIFSVPVMNQPNQDSEPEKTAALIEKIAPMAYCTVPTAHGFCMLMKRKYLKQYGYLDEHTYGRGYGEENDLSQLYQNHGLLNVMSLRSYVVHLESQSFGDETRHQQIAQNLPKVIQKYPTYPQQVAEFIATDPLQTLREMMRFFDRDDAKEWLSTPATLVVVHMNPFSIIGGVEKEALAQLRHLCKKYPAHLSMLYFFDNERGHLCLSLFKGTDFVHNFYFPSDVQPEMALEWILSTFNCTVALVEHLLNHSLEYSSLLKQHKVPALLFVHDFYFIAQLPDLLTQDGVLIDFEATPEAWDKVYRQQLNSFVPHRYWRDRCLALLKNDFTQIIFNSEFTLKHYLQHYSLSKNSRYIVSYPELGAPLHAT